MKRQPKTRSTILFIGDSITDCGRRGPNAPLGDGYVKLFADLLAIRLPQRKFRVVNMGCGGQRILELQERWTDDVIRQRPDVLVMMIGINDACGWVVGAANAITPERYAALYEELMSRTRTELPRCRILLMEPFYITKETAPTSIRYKVLEGVQKYIRIVRRMSRRHRTELLKTHEMFQRLLNHHEPIVFCPEPVHPFQTGHLTIAEAVYDALDL